MVMHRQRLRPRVGELVGVVVGVVGCRTGGSMSLMGRSLHGRRCLAAGRRVAFGGGKRGSGHCCAGRPGKRESFEVVVHGVVPFFITRKTILALTPG